MSTAPDTPGSDPEPGTSNTRAKGGLYGSIVSTAGLDPNVRATMENVKWTTVLDDPNSTATRLTYAFPTSAAAYTADFPNPSETNYSFPNVEENGVVVRTITTFTAVTLLQQQAIETALDLVSYYTGLTFAPATGPTGAEAALRFVNYAEGGSEAGTPTGSAFSNYSSGDNFLGGNGQFKPGITVYWGTDAFNTILHELGHALGLKHGHEPTPNGTLDYKVNDNEFSVMTYWSYIGAGGISDAVLGSSPQSYMMYDIAALQAYYGVNDARSGTSATYTWDKTTGQQKIDGEDAPFTGTTVTNTIFSTVWTQDAIATYDLSNFDADQIDDMRPGRWMLFSPDQIAELNSAPTDAKPQYLAQGNIYNALLYQNDTRSEISNLIAGAGQDKIFGNDLANTIRGNAGDDYLRGYGGDDTLYGGADDDTLVAETGVDTLVGGTGDDIYVIGASATIVEASGEGQDTAFVFIDNYTIGANVEAAYLGAGVTHVTGNDTGMALYARNGLGATIDGGTGDDTLFGADQADTLNGGDGNDTLRGFAGNDSLNGGAGNDRLIGENGADALTGGTGDDTYVVHSAGSTIVENAGEGSDTAFIYVDNYTIGANIETGYVAAGVTNVTGSDTGMAIYARNGFGTAIDGGTGNDALYGADQADTLTGGAGNDILIGGAGDDTFAFARGDGNDRVVASMTDGSDTVAFAAGVSHEQLWFSRSSADLLVSVIGENQAVTVAGWYTSSANHVAQFTAGDGFTATDTAIDQLVQAMSGFTQPGAGQFTLPPDTAAGLETALATTWQPTHA